jgi:hypothetical protein
MNNRDYLIHLSEMSNYYRTKLTEHLQMLGEEIVAMLRQVFGYVVERWQVGDYEEEYCITVYIKPFNEMSNDLWERGYYPLSQLLFEELRELHKEFPPVMIYGDDMIAPDRLETVRSEIRQWLSSEHLIGTCQ